MNTITLKELAVITDKLISNSSNNDTIDAYKAFYLYTQNYITLRDKPYAAQGGDNPKTI